MKDTILRRFFRSYLLVIVPFTCITLLITGCTVADMRRNQESTLNERVEYALAALEELYQQQWENGQALLADAELRYARITSNEIDGQKGIKKLNDFKKYQPQVETVFLDYGNDRLYGNQGMARRDVFLSAVLAPEETAYAEKLLKEKDSGLYFLRTAQEQALFLFHICKTQKDANSVNVLVSADCVLQILEPVVTGLENGGIRLAFADDRTCVFHQDEDGRLAFAPMRENVVGRYQHAFCADLIKVDIVVAYDESVLIRHVKMWQILFGIGNIGVILLSVYIAYSMSRNQSKPISHLARAMERVTGCLTEETRKGDPYGYLYGLLERMSASIHTLETKLNLSRTAFRQHAAVLVFRGLERDENAIRGLCALTGFEVSEEFFALCSISLNQEAPPDSLRCWLQGRLYLETSAQGAYNAVVLLELPNMDEQCGLRREIGQELISQREMGDAQISFSAVCSSLAEIGDAYLELLIHMRSALERRGEGVQCCVAHVPFQGDAQEALEGLEGAFKTGALQDVLRQLEVLARILADDSENQEYADHIRLCVSRLLIAAICVKVDPREKDDMLSDVLRMNLLKTEEYFSGLRGIVYRLYHTPEINGKFQHALEYIGKNYTRSDLSLEMVARACGFSSSYLSKLFRMNFGRRYLDYVAGLRIERAKELLQTSDMRIEEISRAVGYEDVAVFRKHFQAHCGMGAAKYRKLFRMGMNPCDQAAAQKE